MNPDVQRVQNVYDKGVGVYKAKLRPAENDPRYGIKCGVTKNVSATILMF